MARRHPALLLAAAAAAAAAAALLLGACGVEIDSPDVPVVAAAGQRPASDLTEREAARAVQVKSKPPEKLPPAPAVAPTRQAEAKDVELPLYPGAEVVRNEATRAQRQSAVVYLASPDSVETVYAWYKKQMAGSKLREDRLVKDSQSPSATLREERPDGLRQVTITRQGERTMVLLVRLRAAGVFK